MKKVKGQNKTKVGNWFKKVVTLKLKIENLKLELELKNWTKKQK